MSEEWPTELVFRNMFNRLTHLLELQDYLQSTATGVVDLRCLLPTLISDIGRQKAAIEKAQVVWEQRTGQRWPNQETL